jgi:hypothetical protein
LVETTTSLVRTTGVARGWQDERVALTGVVLRQRRVTVPELALRVPGAVLADPVRLVDGGLTIAAPAATLRA